MNDKIPLVPGLNRPAPLADTLPPKPPSPAEIVGVVASRWNVSRSVAARWLAESDFSPATTMEADRVTA